MDDPTGGPVGQAVLERISDAFCAVGHDWRVTAVNHAFERLLRRPRAEILGRHLWDELLPGDIGTRLHRRLADARARSAVVRASHFCRDVKAWLLVRADPLPGGGLAILAQDVTSRKRTKAGVRAAWAQARRSAAHARNSATKARESEARMRAVLNAVVDGILTVDAAGVIEDASAAAERLFGYPPGELRGQPLDVLMTGPEAARHRSSLEAFFRTGELSAADAHREVVGRRRDGTTFPVDLTVSEVRAGGGRRVFTAVVRDLTERRAADAEHLRAEELSIAKEAAEATGRAKDQFLAMLSHELRTPLTPALAVIDDLLHGGATSPQLRAALHEVRQGIVMEARLIDDLLDLTRIGRGKLLLHLTVVDAHAAVLRALDTVRSDAANKRVGMTLAMHAPEHLVRADPARLQQVLWNLLKNAVKFTPEGGEITVRTRTADVGLVVEVEDTGIGIEPEALPHIFHAFEQADPSIGQRFGGLGLGLSICRSLMEMMGGRVTAASEGHGKGSRFTIELPLTSYAGEARTADDATAGAGAAAGAEPAGANHGPQVGRRLRILLVEDHRNTATIMAHLLRRLGHTVELADTVQAAIGLAESQQFDVLLSDIGLPDGSGLDLMRDLRQRGHRMPAVALSGYGMDDDIRASLAAGFAEHLVKPIELTHLELMIQRIVP
jgi:PAS domain S-box-containing protein